MTVDVTLIEEKEITLIDLSIGGGMNTAEARVTVVNQNVRIVVAETHERASGSTLLPKMKSSQNQVSSKLYSRLTLWHKQMVVATF
jgi:hypothetical protein